MNRTMATTWMTTLLLSTAALADYNPHPYTSCKASLQEIKETRELADRIIANLRGQSASLNDPHGREKMNNRLDELERLVAKMARPGEGCAGPGAFDGSGQGVHIRVPIDGLEFAVLLRDLDRSFFGDARLRVLQQAAPRHYFTVEQLVQIVRKLTYSADKVRAVQLIYPRLSDPANFRRVLAELAFRSDRQLLERFARDYNRRHGF